MIVICIAHLALTSIYRARKASLNWRGRPLHTNSINQFKAGRAQRASNTFRKQFAIFAFFQVNAFAGFEQIAGRALPTRPRAPIPRAVIDHGGDGRAAAAVRVETAAATRAATLVGEETAKYTAVAVDGERETRLARRARRRVGVGGAVRHSARGDGKADTAGEVRARNATRAKARRGVHRATDDSRLWEAFPVSEVIVLPAVGASAVAGVLGAAGKRVYGETDAVGVEGAVGRAHRARVGRRVVLAEGQRHSQRDAPPAHHVVHLTGLTSALNAHPAGVVPRAARHKRGSGDGKAEPVGGGRVLRVAGGTGIVTAVYCATLYKGVGRAEGSGGSGRGDVSGRAIVAGKPRADNVAVAGRRLHKATGSAARKVHWRAAQTGTAVRGRRTREG